ncbi:MAG: PIN domain-containing protein [Planktothrix sp.]|uniref:PIN domain-containing protein n=1 Tax=Planktothrix sp. TaxID=3088171 RepID=UPI0038D4E843
MRIYLDTSVYNRPYDDQTQAKIYLETQAVLIILNLIETQQIESVNSSVLEYENQKNPVLIIQTAIKKYLTEASLFQPLNETIRQRAKQLETEGIKPIDALHVASFESSKSNYFITCDKRLLNRCQALAIPAINPINFIEELDDEN